ncbi:hypothetical protein D3C73_1450280 [compost metagenome]
MGRRGSFRLLAIASRSSSACNLATIAAMSDTKGIGISSIGGAILLFGEDSGHFRVIQMIQGSLH